MSSLPNDVLYDIFHRITVNAPSRSWSDKGVMIEPLFASHVCRRWRQVALSHGTLWSYLCIYDFGWSGPRRRERMLDVFRTWLERTGKAPLNFSIGCRVAVEDVEGHRQMELVVKSLVAEQQRWKDVRFSWSFRTCSSEFTSIELTNMPMLSSIKLKAQIRTCDDEQIIPYFGIARSRQLECMQLSGRYTIETGEDPIHSIRRVVCKDLSEGVECAKQCFAILKACPNLGEISLEQIRSPAPDQTLSETRFVHNVQTLRLQDVEATAAALVMDKLTLPELKYLEITPSYIFGLHHILPEFFERSRPRLEKLEIDGYYTTSNQLIHVLHMLPSLQELIIYDGESAGELFEGLTRSGDGPITCPMLRYIRLDPWFSSGGTTLERELDVLYRMAMSRGEGTTMTGTVTFNNKLRIPISRIWNEFRKGRKDKKTMALLFVDERLDLYFDLKNE